MNRPLSRMLGAAALAGVAVTGLGSTDAAAQDKLRIALIPGLTTDVFYITMRKGAQAAADNLGVELIFQGAPEFNPTSLVPASPGEVCSQALDVLDARGVHWERGCGCYHAATHSPGLSGPQPCRPHRRSRRHSKLGGVGSCQVEEASIWKSRVGVTPLPRVRIPLSPPPLPHKCMNIQQVCCVDGCTYRISSHILKSLRRLPILPLFGLPLGGKDSSERLC